MKKIKKETLNQNVGYDLIIDEITDYSRVLDLGCGDGVLLEMLRRMRRVDGFGVELSSDGVSKCLEKGLYCYHGDIDDGLADYKNNSFDYCILNQTLQNTKRPEYVLQEIMRICRYAIISFPNFAYLPIRLELLYKGTMPVNDELPFEWYDSPNIHLLSIKDFQNYCKSHAYPIRDEMHFSTDQKGEIKIIKYFPNLFAQYGFFILDGERFSGRA